MLKGFCVCLAPSLVPFVYWKPLVGYFEKSEDPDEMSQIAAFHMGVHCNLRQKQSSQTEVQQNLGISTGDPLKYIMDNPNLIVFIFMGQFTRIQWVNFSSITKYYIKG